VLRELRIRNFAIIESIALPLEPGFNVLSGETGAGKSIIVGALGFLAGERQSGEVVRTGAEKATVEGEFDIAGRADIAAALDAHGLESDGGAVVLKREVAAAGGRTRAWVNGSPVSAGVVAEVGRLLVNVHGQHEAQALLDESSQRAILDSFGGATSDAEAVLDAHGALERAREALRTLLARRDEAARRADYLRHVAREIAEAALREGEDRELEDESRRLAHAEELRGLAGQIATTLDGADEAVLRRVGHLQRAIAGLARIDPATARFQELYDAAYYALEELSRAAATYLDSLEHDPTRLEAVERRRDLLHRLLRKYGGSVAAALETARTARAELDLLDTAALDVRTLEENVSAAESRLRTAAEKLSDRRRETAGRLAAAVEARLPDLGMPDGRFFVDLVPRDGIGPNGAEDVTFRVALNVGHDARALARVASGGELSRVMLALKTILARQDRVPTLIFDEVDAGIGGQVGTMIGDALRAVAAHHQVFAITHLPQIAARAHHHIVVSKSARGGVTAADVSVVEGDERVAEIARMLGGDATSRLSREHARELLGDQARARVGKKALA
jgi:DNA repair protein RecN (Recombination protein N)